eukprot:PITA_10002
MDNMLITLVYLDDLIFGSYNDEMSHKFAQETSKEFEMSMIGELPFFLGIQVTQTNVRMFIRQTKYLKGMLRRFGMEECAAVSTPMITDADWARGSTDRKSSSSCTFGLGSVAVSWFNRKQGSVALSSAEAEYMAASLAACKAIWLRNLLVGLLSQKLEPAIIHYDNQSCIKLSENLVFHDRSKHIKIWYHHIRDCVQRGKVRLQYVPIEVQSADILTKALARGIFVYFRD